MSSPHWYSCCWLPSFSCTAPGSKALLTSPGAWCSHCVLPLSSHPFCSSFRLSFETQPPASPPLGNLPNILSSVLPSPWDLLYIPLLHSHPPLIDLTMFVPSSSHTWLTVSPGRIPRSGIAGQMIHFEVRCPVPNCVLERVSISTPTSRTLFPLAIV